MGTWDIQMEDGRWVEREGYTFLLTDRITASSGETAVEFLHTVENTLTVGIPTSGCSLGANHIDFYLPNTGLRLYFGTGLSFNETMENRTGWAISPTCGSTPSRPPVAVARLCGYYGLKEPVS